MNKINKINLKKEKKKIGYLPKIQELSFIKSLVKKKLQR